MLAEVPTGLHMSNILKGTCWITFYERTMDIQALIAAIATIKLLRSSVSKFKYDVVMNSFKVKTGTCIVINKFTAQ